MGTRTNAVMIQQGSRLKGKTSRCKMGGCSHAVDLEEIMRSRILTLSLEGRSLLLKMIKMHIATRTMQVMVRKSR